MSAAEANQAVDWVIPCDFCDERAVRFCSTGPPSSRRFFCANETHRDWAHWGYPPIPESWGQIRTRFLGLDFDTLEAHFKALYRAGIITA